MKTISEYTNAIGPQRVNETTMIHLLGHLAQTEGFAMITAYKGYLRTSSSNCFPLTATSSL